MTFEYLYAMLGKHDLRISHMEERIDQQYVEYKDKKGNNAWKYEPHNLKTLHVISWNTADFHNTVFLFTTLRDTTWNHMFEDMGSRIREKFA